MGASSDPGSRGEVPTPSYAERVRESLRVRCVHLLTKEAFVGEPAPHEHEFEADGAIWWCDLTAGPLGPDGSAADAGRCDRAVLDVGPDHGS